MARSWLALLACLALFAYVQVSPIAARSLEYEAAQMAPPPAHLLRGESSFVEPELREPALALVDPPRSPPSLEASIGEADSPLATPAVEIDNEEEEVPRIHPVGPEQPPRIHPIGPERPPERTPTHPVGPEQPPRIHPIGPEKPHEHTPTRPVGPEVPSRIHPIGPERSEERTPTHPVGPEQPPRIHPIGPERPHEHTPTHPVGPEMPPHIHPIGPEQPHEHTPTHPVGPEQPPRIHPIGPEQPPRIHPIGPEQPPRIHPIGPEQSTEQSEEQSMAGQPIVVLADELQNARNDILRGLGGLLSQLLGGAATPDLNDSPAAVAQAQEQAQEQPVSTVEQSSVPVAGGVLTTSTRHIPGGMIVSREFRAGGPLIQYPTADDPDDEPLVVEADVVPSPSEEEDEEVGPGLPVPPFVRHFLRHFPRPRFLFDSAPPHPFLHRGMFDRDDDSFPLKRQEHVPMSGEGEGEAVEGEQEPGMPQTTDTDSDSETEPRRHLGRRGGCKRHGRHHYRHHGHGPHHRLPLMARLRQIFDQAANGDVPPPPPPPPFFSSGPLPMPPFTGDDDEYDEPPPAARPDLDDSDLVHPEWAPGTPATDVPNVDESLLTRASSAADDVPMTLEEAPLNPSLLQANVEEAMSEPEWASYRHHHRSRFARWVHRHRVAIWAVGGALTLLLLGAVVFVTLRRAHLRKEAASRGPMVLMAAPSAAFESVVASDPSASSVPYVRVPDEAEPVTTVSAQMATVPLVAQDV